MNLDAIAQSPALAGMRARPQWVLWTLERDANRPNKPKKLPLNARTGGPASSTDPNTWADFPTACAGAKQHGLRLGYVFADDHWFIDLDACLQADNTWSTAAVSICQTLAGAAIEVSQSGKGLHLFGRGAVPPGHRNKNAEHRAEFYTSGRFVALTGDRLQGDCETDHTAGLATIIASYFAPRPEATHNALSGDGPRPDWRGPTDDGELIRRALGSRSAASVFNGKASFADVWNGNVEALARAYPADPSSSDPYDRSSADARLFQDLAFWVGCDQERMRRIASLSALKRDKWERDDYLPRTIANACARQRDVLQDKPPPSAAPGSVHILKETPLDTARQLILHKYTSSGKPCLKSWQDTFYVWTGAAWREATTADIKSRVYGFIEEHGWSQFKPNQTAVSNVLDALKHAPEVHLDSAFIAPGWLSSDAAVPTSEIVACANGLFHLPSRVLLPATPELFNLNAVPYPYEPGASAPAAWHRFLAEVWPQDSEAIATLQEVFGYLLTPDTSQQKIFMLIGPKRSGKGTIARVLTELLGNENVTGPTLSSLSESFGLAPLVGKLAAVISDARLSGRADQKEVAEQLLRISGEDRVEVNRKFQKPMSVRLGVRFVMLTNEIPKIADASGAMASRFIILKMWESFLGREDPGLTSRLLKELPGILNWSVEGWHRLKARGHFVQPRSAADAVQELADLGSPIGAFVRDECITSPSATVKVDDLYRAWTTWCALQGNPHAGTKQVFGRDLTALLPSITVKRARDGADRERWYVGIGLGGPQWSAVHPISPFPSHSYSPNSNS